MRVLLVEDNDRMRRCIRWLLEDEGIEVADLETTRDLVTQARDCDVVVLDIGVSGDAGDPRTALEQLAGAGTHPPLVVFSAYAQPYLRSVCSKACRWEEAHESRDCLEKPSPACCVMPVLL